jgi:hypothetical protein
MAGLRWLHRIGYLTTAIAIAALGYFGYAQYRDWKQPKSPPSAPSQVPSRYVYASLWNVSSTSSPSCCIHGPRAGRERICINDMSQAEVWTCAGDMHLLKSPGPPNQTVSCSEGVGKQTTSVVVSKDGNVRIRSQYDGGGVATNLSAESTLIYAGECPVKLKRDQPFVVVKSDGHVVDPFAVTDCMVRVLRTVPGVTEPKFGYAWGLDGGPLRFVQYSYPSRYDHQPVRVTFWELGDVPNENTKPEFDTRMSGLFTEGEKGPDDYGANTIIPRWKASCGVGASIEYP